MKVTRLVLLNVINVHKLFSPFTFIFLKVNFPVRIYVEHSKNFEKKGL